MTKPIEPDRIIQKRKILLKYIYIEQAGLKRVMSRTKFTMIVASVRPRLEFYLNPCSFLLTGDQPEEPHGLHSSSRTLI